MIARIWRGWASLETADAYQRHYELEVAQHLQTVPGFQGARLLRGEEDDVVAFTSLVFFSGLDAVRAFAGPDYEIAVIEPTARQVLSRWDDRVAHLEVVVELSGQPGTAARLSG